MNTQKYRIERIGPGSIADFVWLYNAVHSNTPITNAQAIQRFNTLPFGTEYIGFFAYNDKQPIAYYGVYPIHLRLNGRNVLAAQSGDTMTHSDYRKQGLFILLANETYKLAAQKGIKIIYGLPNKYSYMGLVKLGWMEQCKMTCYTIETIPTFKSRLHRKWFVRSFNRMITGSQSANKGKNTGKVKFYSSLAPFHVERSEVFYRYKLQDDNQLLEFKHGYAFIKIRLSELFLGDYMVKDNGDEQQFWEELKQFSSKMGCYIISFDITPDLEKKYTLPANVIKTEGLSLMLLDLGLNSSEKLTLTRADYDTF